MYCMKSLRAAGSVPCRCMTGAVGSVPSRRWGARASSTALWAFSRNTGPTHRVTSVSCSSCSSLLQREITIIAGEGVMFSLFVSVGAFYNWNNILSFNKLFAQWL